MATDEREFASDGYADLKGRPVIRRKTGGWRACSLIIAYECCERMAFAGIWANLVVYLTTKLHEGTVSSSRNSTNWTGTTWLTPVLGAYIADTYLGRYWTLIMFSCIYILGMGIITLAVSLKSLIPPECPSNEGCQKASSLQIGIFYLALYLLALGSGGTIPNISTFGADQFDDFDSKEKMQKNSFFNWWIFIVFLGSLFGQTVIVYIQDQISWGLGYGIMTALLIIASLVFMLGTPIYRHKVQAGSPLQRMAKVIVRMIFNWKVHVPSDSSSLHEVSSQEYLRQGRYPIARTKLLRFLDKAAVQNGGSSSKPCTVTDVEETKLVMRILPIWLTTILPSTSFSQTSTLFVRQAMTLDRQMGSNFKIPAASIGAFLIIAMLVSLMIYDRLLVPICRRFTRNPRGITILQRMGIGMLIYNIAMVAAMITEINRLKVVKNHGLADNPNAIVPRTIFTLLPQFIITGVAESFIEVAKLEFFYDQAPENMRSLGTALYATAIGLGSFISSLELTIVTDITGRHGHKSWILDNLNASRLDYYYAFLGVVNFLNYIIFLIISYFYTYKRETSEAFEKGDNGDGIKNSV